MVMLTEEMVIARTKQSNLAAITKLNCWGAQLSDVTILRRMPNITVVSFSVNSINTLADFQFCPKLTDLFVRKNNIKDLNEVCYLKDLVHLRSLFLDENPCVGNCKDENYRYSVIRALPQLQKLDDVAVEPTEAERAVRLGKVLVHPEQQEEYYSDPDEEETIYIVKDKEPDIVQQSQGWHQQESIQQYNNIEPERVPSPQPHYQERQNHINHESSEPEPVTFQDNGSPKQSADLDLNRTEPQQLTRSSSFKSEESMDVYAAPSNMRNNHNYNSIPRSRTTDGELGYCQDYNNRRYSRSSCGSTNCRGGRPAERQKTNILNAVLCLIKELDYHNLEVVDMAVKCRMDELDG